MSKRLSARDEEAWRLYARTVQRLPGRQVLTEPRETAPASVSATATPPASANRPYKPPPSPLTAGEAPAGLDGATWRRFRAGKLPVERRLDLHGHTVEAAFQAVERFLMTAHGERHRCVEIITGRGLAGGGLIRRELPHWLDAPRLRPLLLATVHDGRNTGAMRLLLRRARS